MPTTARMSLGDIPPIPQARRQAPGVDPGAHPSQLPLRRLKKQFFLHVARRQALAQTQGHTQAHYRSDD